MSSTVLSLILEYRADPDPQVRRNVLTALAQLSETGAAETFVDIAAGDSDASVRAFAQAQIATLPPERRAAYFEPALARHRRGHASPALGGILLAASGEGGLGGLRLADRLRFAVQLGMPRSARAWLRTDWLLLVLAAVLGAALTWLAGNLLSMRGAVTVTADVSSSWMQGSALLAMLLVWLWTRRDARLSQHLFLRDGLLAEALWSALVCTAAALPLALWWIGAFDTATTSRDSLLGPPGPVADARASTAWHGPLLWQSIMLLGVGGFAARLGSALGARELAPTSEVRWNALLAGLAAMAAGAVALVGLVSLRETLLPWDPPHGWAALSVIATGLAAAAVALGVREGWARGNESRLQQRGSNLQRQLGRVGLLLLGAGLINALVAASGVVDKARDQRRAPIVNLSINQSSAQPFDVPALLPFWVELDVDKSMLNKVLRLALVPTDAADDGKAGAEDDNDLELTLWRMSDVSGSQTHDLAGKPPLKSFDDPERGCFVLDKEGRYGAAVRYLGSTDKQVTVLRLGALLPIILHGTIDPGARKMAPRKLKVDLVSKEEATKESGPCMRHASRETSRGKSVSSLPSAFGPVLSGSIVTIRKPTARERGGPGWNDKMDEWIGKPMTVSEVDGDDNTFRVDENRWWWSTRWLTSTKPAPGAAASAASAASATRAAVAPRAPPASAASR